MTISVQDLYARIYPLALAAYAQKSPDMESAKQMARAVSAECAMGCARLMPDIIDGGFDASPARPQPYGAGAPGIPSFAETKFEGAGPQPITPPGAPQQPVQHYNHVTMQPGAAQPSPVGGQQIFPPSGPKYEPPQQAGVMGTVTQVPTPAGFNALGTNGVIQQPEQRPNGKDVVVAPGNQPMIPAVGGNGTTFVPEKIVR
jgi:hypothetical protein